VNLLRIEGWPFDVEKNEALLIYELCAGCLDKRRVWREGDSVIILRDVLLGLNALHRRQILHRDVKPDVLSL
jgi:serine/threonine protein kinase